MAIRVNLGIHTDKPIVAYVDDQVIRSWIMDRMEASIKLFRQKMHKPSPSAPFSYPANVSGNMSSGIQGPFLYGLTGRVDQSARNKQGTDYVPFHLRGTSRMASRKLVGDALKEVLRARPRRDFLASAAKFGAGRTTRR